MDTLPLIDPLLRRNRRLQPRVLAVEPSGFLYGSEACLLDIVRGTAGRGVDWEVITPSGGGFDGRLDEAKVPRVSGILPRNLGETAKWKKAWAYWKLRRHLEAAVPDVLYVNQAGVLRAVEWASRRVRTPLVCQVQTLEDARFVGAATALHPRVQAFICNSEFIANIAQLPADRTCVCYQPMTMAGIEGVRTPLAPPDGPWRIGILGRIAPSKGHPILLKAAARIEALRPGTVEYVVIGDGLRAGDREAFEHSVAAEGLAERFDFRGFRTDVETELARLHILAIPSLAEPLGRVMLDAARARVPAVVSDAGGLGEFCRHFEIGVPFVSGDDAGLAAALISVMDAYERQAEIFGRQAGCMLERLDPGDYFDAMEKMLEAAARRETVSMKWKGRAL